MTTLSSVLGTIAAIASLLLTFIGFPAQIWKNFRRKSCEGIAPYLIYSAFVGYLTWGAYGISKPDWFLIASDVPGCFLTLILVIQLFVYKKKKLPDK